MNKILSEFDWNKMYRCIVKHAIFAYELSCELLYASPDDDELRTNQYNMSKILYKLLSKFIWTEVVSCGRCLNDIMQDWPKVTQESLFQ